MTEATTNLDHHAPEGVSGQGHRSILATPKRGDC
jgi:hypothetical protein